MIEVTNLSKEVLTPHRAQILHNCNLTLESGMFVAIVGSSGAGKSSLLHCIGGLDVPSQGSVVLDGCDLYALSEDKRTRFVRERISCVFQDYNLLDFLTVEENICFVDQLLKRKTNRGEIHSILESVNLPSMGGMKINRLSGGEKQRVAIARALYAHSRVILADEPTGALDAVNTTLLVQTFRRLTKMGIAVLIVTHDIEVASAADLVIFMHNGAITNAIRTPSKLAIQENLLKLHEEY